MLLMGVRVAVCSHAEALTWMADAVERGSPTYVVTLNAQYYRQMHKDDEFRKHVQLAGLACPEFYVVWAARRLGIATLQHIGGINLLRDFLQLSAERGFRVYLLGAAPAVADALAVKVSEQYGGGLLAGHHHGYLAGDDATRVAEEILRVRPDAVFVAMGVPRQDLWIREYGRTLGIPLCMGVGGSFDVLAGFKRDTPSWARGRGLEWLYRICVDPRAYLRRYMDHHVWFFLEICRQKAQLIFGKVERRA